jgi:hypothetical protein
MINVLIIFLMCKIFKGKKVKIKNDAAFRISYSTQRYKVWSFSQNFFFFHRLGKWWKKCSPLPWSKRQLGWGLVPFSAPKPSLHGATQPVLLVENQVSTRHPNPFYRGPPWLDFPGPVLPRATWLCIWIPFVPGPRKCWAPVLRNHVLPRAKSYSCPEELGPKIWSHTNKGTWNTQPSCHNKKGTWKPQLS